MLFSQFMGAILPLVAIFIAKAVDNMLGTFKTIFVQRDRRVLASIALALSSFITLFVTKLIVNEDGILSMIVASTACGVGCYAAMDIDSKMSKDRLYVNIVMSDNIEAMQKLRDYLAKHHITNVAHDSYTKDWQKSITITVYAETKAESKLLDEYLEKTGLKFKRKLIKAQQ